MEKVRCIAADIFCWVVLCGGITGGLWLFLLEAAEWQVR